MKKGFWGIFALGFIGFLILLVVERNLKLIQQNKAVSEKTASVVQMEKEAVPEEVSAAQMLITEEAQKAAEPEPAAPPKNFLEDSVHAIELYQAANQKFLEDQRIKAEHLAQTEDLFSRALDVAFALEPSSPLHGQVKDRLVEASESRLRSVRILNQLRKEQEDRSVDALWSENVEFLRKANEAITQAVRMTGELISDESDASDGQGNTSSLMEALRKCTKGILVVSRSGN